MLASNGEANKPSERKQPQGQGGRERPTPPPPKRMQLHRGYVTENVESSNGRIYVLWPALLHSENEIAS